MGQDTVDTIIWKNLKDEIEHSEKSKTQIARELGVSKATISQYLSGKIQPSLSTFARLCVCLNCSADEILNIKLK